MIKIICFGKIKEQYLRDAISDYETRINKYHKLQIIELKDDEDILKEEKQMIKYFTNNDYNVVLDIKGTKIDSVTLAKLVDDKLMHYGNINLFIGSSNGITKKLKNLANELISFGDITMPHGLFRLVLVEQIYRSFKINNNEKYHK